MAAQKVGRKWWHVRQKMVAQTTQKAQSAKIPQTTQTTYTTQTTQMTQKPQTIMRRLGGDIRPTELPTF